MALSNLRFISAILLCALPLAIGLAQPLRITVAEELAKKPDVKAVLVSNQFGVLRYYHPWQADQARQELSFEVNQRLGERLALTVVREVEENGLFRFQNTTYTQLANGAKIGLPDEADKEDVGRFQNVELILAGPTTVQDVLVLSPLQGWPEYRIDRSGLVVNFRAPDQEDLTAVFKIDSAAQYRPYFGQFNRRRIEIDTNQLGAAIQPVSIALPAKHFWEGTVKGYHRDSQRPYYAYHSEQPKATAPFDTIQLFLPDNASQPGWNFWEVELTTPGGAVYRFEQRFRQGLPAALETFDFNPLMTEAQSKAFRFKTEEAEVGLLYAVTYYYSLYNEKDASWQILGQVGQAGEIDFILPDLPDELMQSFPELRTLAQPVAVRKSMSRCAACEGYEFGKEPSAPQKKAWRFQKGLATREQEVDL
jgi:hypothetical protein